MLWGAFLCHLTLILLIVEYIQKIYLINLVFVWFFFLKKIHSQRKNTDLSSRPKSLIHVRIGAIYIYICRSRQCSCHLKVRDPRNMIRKYEHCILYMSKITGKVSLQTDVMANHTDKQTDARWSSWSSDHWSMETLKQRQECH